MFMKRKPVPAGQQGSDQGGGGQERAYSGVVGGGGGGSGSGSGSGGKGASQNNSPASPPPEFPYGVPTLHPSPGVGGPSSPRHLPIRNSKHGRSVSQPFPSILASGNGGAGKEMAGKPADTKGGKGAGSKLGFFSTSLPKSSSKTTQPSEPDLVTGRCATCDSTVRWPRHLDVFRCTVCMMVNDLQYGTIKESGSGQGQAPGQAGIRPSRKTMPISIDRTKALIGQCTQAYLRHQIDELQKRRTELNPTAESAAAAATATTTAAAAAGGRPTPRHNPFLNAQAAHTNQRSSSRDRPRQGQEREWELQEKRSFDGGGSRPRTAPGQPRMSEEMAPLQAKYIFRSLENYLLSCMTDCDSLNMSFAIARPPAPVRAASEMSQQEVQKRFDPHDAPEFLPGELDPKMLLLGDIGENARFWLGDGSDHFDGQEEPRSKDQAHEQQQQQQQHHHRHHNQHQQHQQPLAYQHSQASPPLYRKNSAPTVERRPPRFNWKAVWDWYQSILLCGRNWRSLRAAAFTEAERVLLEEPKVEHEIDQMLSEGRHHVQRTLLKATENLLRQPGRPMKRAEDSRFLLILLSNPLLHPQHSHHGSSTWNAGEQAQDASTAKFPSVLPSDQAARKLEHAKSAAAAASKGSATGHHSGIIKRLTGLIGNLPPECHSTMISWLHRMPVAQLRDLVDLVGGFVSYRLTRNAGRTRAHSHDPTSGLIPVLTGPAAGVGAQLHAAIGHEPSSAKPAKGAKEKDRPKENAYADDWQVKAAAKVMSLLFFANFGHVRGRQQLTDDQGASGNNSSGSSSSKSRTVRPGQALALNEYYNVLLDDADLIADFELWELRRSKFSFCQYPMFLSLWAKIKLMEYDARRQMQEKARTAFFESIMTRKVLNQYLTLHVRRDCLVEDSLKEIGKVVGGSEDEIKKGLKIEFDGEEGVDIGGLRKEWFLLLVREVFDPRHGLFLYDDDSQYCYFNQHTLETSEQYYLVGVVLGLAIYNSTILDITLPPFLFRKLLAAAPPWTGPSISAPRTSMTYTLDDLAEWRPHLARGLRQLLEFDGDVQETFCRDFVVDVERYGVMTQVPLVSGGERRPVTNSSRREFVDLYVRHVLDWSVARQFEPFKRGFFAVCSGNALALFRPEEIELLVRGSDEPLDVNSLQAVALYDSWEWAKHGVNVSDIPDIDKKPVPVPTGVADLVPMIRWFWQTFREATPKDQRRLLGFVTGSDRIPAMGATSLVIKVACLGDERDRFPIARTCFNTIGLYEYESKEQLEHKLWMAVGGSEGFGLK